MSKVRGSCLTLKNAKDRYSENYEEKQQSIEDVAAYIRFRRAVTQLKETAIAVGVIKSPYIGGSTDARA